MSEKPRGGTGRAVEEPVEAGFRFGGGAGASLGPASPAHTEMLSHSNNKAQQAEQHADYRLHPQSTTTQLVRLGEHCKQQGTPHHASAHLQTWQDSWQTRCHAPATALLHLPGQHQRLLLTAMADFSALRLHCTLPSCTCWNGTTSLRPQAAATYRYQPLPHPRHQSQRFLRPAERFWLAALPVPAPLDLHLLQTVVIADT